MIAKVTALWLGQWTAAWMGDCGGNLRASMYAAEGARLDLTLRLISVPVQYVVRQSDTIFSHLSGLF